MYLHMYLCAQELVFIGQFGENSGNSRRALEEVLDSCLLTDGEMVEYEGVVDAGGGDEKLKDMYFPKA